MISIIVYGRNDAHGYNLHRRAALSLNCLAEVLTDDDDEIIFVDYNTPDQLPTLVEAFADTLTARCLSRLRVLRVPAALHRERFEPLTHLPAIEPVCRNAAARRMNPANRWLLSTNTDMVLVPHSGKSLSDVCRDQADGFYALPRFELPEWLWEQLPRSDPRKAISDLRDLGPRLHLDEVSPGHEWVRFDAPGDFQLCLRDDFVAIDGFDERMLLGWHVDSNFSRRMLLHRGTIGSLEDAVGGYHCNHNRTPTVYHGPQPVGNDHNRFFLAVERADLPDQHEGWGLADAVLPEVAVGPRAGGNVTKALLAAVPAAALNSRPSWNPFEAALALTYDSAHVLPHVADSIVVSGGQLTVGYLGANPVLRDMIGRVVRDVSRDGSLRFLHASDPRGASALVEPTDLFIVDFGLDAALEPDLAWSQGGGGVGVPSLPEALHPVVTAFADLIAKERENIGRGAHPRRFILINSTTVYLDTFVIANLDCSSRATHSRVRRATVKPVPTDVIDLLRDMRWADRLESPPRPLPLRVGESTPLGELDDFGGFGSGWWFPDPGGVWTCGPRAVLTVRCRGRAWIRPVLELRFDRVGTRRGHPVQVGLAIDGARVDTHVVEGGSRSEVWRGNVPDHALVKRVFDVSVELDGPVEWADDNQLGLHLREVVLRTGLLPRPLHHGLDVAGSTRARLVARLRAAVSRRISLSAVRSVRRRGVLPP